MSNATSRKLALLACLTLVGIGGFVFTRRLNHAQTEAPVALDNDVPAPHGAAAQTNLAIHSSGPLSEVPLIVADTTTDSPGTNLVTRIVTFTAEIVGAPPLFRQWKVDKGSGFVAVSAGATNSTFIITNAGIADTGRYALFATNALGSTNTTPMPLVVVEGTD
jgi:hypothetical protein